MGPFILAWLTGEGIISYRSIKKNHAPPGPGELLISSGLFVMLGLLAQSEKTRSIAVTLAWGFDIAAFMNLFNIAVVKGGGNWPPALAPDTVVIPNGNLTIDTKTPNSGTAQPPKVGVVPPPPGTGV